MWGEDVGRIMRGVVGWQPTSTAKLGRSPLIGGKILVSHQPHFLRSIYDD